MTARPYFHYTCDHGRAALGDDGNLLPAAQFTNYRDQPWTSNFVWLTDLAKPDCDALGLTSHLIECDRTRHRYRVVQDAGIVPWHVTARALTRDLRELVEATPGAQPAHWYVTTYPTPVVYDPMVAFA